MKIEFELKSPLHASALKQAIARHLNALKISNVKHRANMKSQPHERSAIAMSIVDNDLVSEQLQEIAKAIAPVVAAHNLGEKWPE